MALVQWSDTTNRTLCRVRVSGSEQCGGVLDRSCARARAKRRWKRAGFGPSVRKVQTLFHFPVNFLTPGISRQASCVGFQSYAQLGEPIIISQGEIHDRVS